MAWNHENACREAGVFMVGYSEGLWTGEASAIRLAPRPRLL